MAVSDLCTHFPLLCPRSLPSKPPHEFCGFMNIAGVDREVRLETPHYPRLDGVRISSDTHLHCLASTCVGQLQQAQASSKTVLDFLLKFQEVCSNAEKTMKEEMVGKKSAKKKKITIKEKVEEKAEEEEEDVEEELNAPLVTCLLAHLERLGWSRVRQVSSNFTAFTLQMRDSGGRTHLLHVKVGSGYPQVEPQVEADLPEGFHYDYDQSEGIVGVVRAWEERVCALQEFWDVMDAIDATAVVLDPPHPPSRRHTFRRLLLGNQVNIQVTISPLFPHRLPQWHLFGPARLTGPMGTRLTTTYEEWDQGQSIVNNLEHITGEKVVVAVEGGACGGAGGVEEHGVECSVCYELHLGAALPDQICEHCCKAFHAECVYEWLSNLSSSRQTMNMISGECPYCSKNIFCKIPT